MDLMRIPICLLWIIFVYHDYSKACVFHSQDGLGTEAEGVRFIRVREDLLIGKEIILLRAYPRTSIVIRGVDRSTDHKYFRLNELNSTTVQILLDKSLEDLVDRDVPQNLLKFRVFCTGTNGRTEEAAYMSITVYIEDVNDHTPVFLNEPYSIEVDESTSPGTILYQNIQAFDRDKPNTPNSDVQITIRDDYDDHVEHNQPYFILESPHRPYLILKRSLDFDIGIREFVIPLIASDRGTPSKSTNTTLKVTVKDHDDLPPKFTEGVYRTKLNEFYPLTGKKIHTPLYFTPPIMAFDQDSLNATLIYDIISGNERQLFRVNPLNGIIYLEREIDLEEESLPGNTFVLQIEARQKDSPLKRALARIEIEIMDLNDNPPEFEVELYNISIVENLPSGFSVLQVNANDRDQGENAEFFYNLIEEKPTGAFSIDARTGWITVRDHNLLDRELRTSIAMVVQAVERNHPYDQERARDTGTVEVEITLLDSNDNTPQFENGNLYEFKVSVNSAVNTVIGKVTAKDPDEGRNGMILYELQRPKGSGYIPFKLDSQTGTIIVSGPLRRGRIALFVEASDQPTNPSERRFSLAVVTIEVHPVISEDAIDFVGSPYEFWVGADVPVGTSVGQVRTTLDYDSEGDIMYDLLHSYPEGVPFAIEERSGIVTVIRNLDEFDRAIYYFEAVANYQFSNHPRGHLTRRTSRSEKQVTKSGDVLEIDEGVISDTENVLVTNVTIHVVGPGDDRGVLMRGTDVNPIEFHIKENIPGALIGRLLYKNGKTNERSSDYKDLIGQSTNIRQNRLLNSKFRRNSTSFPVLAFRENKYPISRRRKIRELTDDLVAYVTPSVLFDDYLEQQNSGRSLSSLTTRRSSTWRPLTTNKTTRNKTSSTTISEATTIGNSNRSKKNSTNNNEKRSKSEKPVGLRFLIANQQDVTNKITIMEDGTLMTLSGLDREVRDIYRLTVIAEYSKGFISGAGIYQVNVLVDDVNDNPPVFDAPIYSGIIYENSPKGTEIILNRPIKVSDADVGKNAEFTLNLIGDGNDMFTIELFNVTLDLKNSSISLFDSHEQFDIEKNFIDMQLMLLNPNRTTIQGPYYRLKYIGLKSLDRERDHFYNLNLIAKDTGGLSSTVRLNVLVADVNDNAPIFEKIAVFKDSGVEIIEYTNDMEIYFVERMDKLKLIKNLAPAAVAVAVASSPVASSSSIEYALPGSPRFAAFTNQSRTSRISRIRRGEIHKTLFRQSKKFKNPALFSIQEDIPVGTTVLKVTATDDDAEKNSQVFYEIESETLIPIRKIKDVLPSINKKLNQKSILRYFNIDRISGEIKINQPLQSNVEILLNITAKDIGGLSDRTSIRFNIIDVNNHAPVFKKSWYSFDLQEGEYFDQSIDRIEATDADYGQNSNVTYKIENALHALPFEISARSGVLKINGILDREFKSQYEFLIIANDNAADKSKSLTASVEVEINVLDVNDNAPEFIGYDDILNLDGSASITNNNELLEESSRKITTSTITTNDDNLNHKPQVSTPVYKAYLNRDTIPGTFVKQITALDKDYTGNGNGLVMFSLLHHHRMPHLFEIDSRDGIITTVAKFNRYNGYEHINLTIIASDLGNPSKSSNAILLVNLQGEDILEEEDNENQLNIFPHKYYEIEIMENNQFPMDVIQINTTFVYNKDTFKWTIIPEYDDEDQDAAFEINTNTGVIRVIKALDREVKDVYRLKVRAERLGREPRRTYPTIMYPIAGDRIHGLQENEIRVVVHVGDENDHSPKFKGNGRPIVTVIPNSANFGYPVAEVEAIDADLGINAEIRYKLLNEPSKLFGIDEETGKIRVLGPVSQEKRVYGFDVKATDRRGEDDGHSSIANVFVYVLDENKQVRLVIMGQPLQVEKQILNLMEQLSLSTGMDVRIRLLEPHLDGNDLATDAYIYAVDPKSNTIVDMEELQKSLAMLDMDNLALTSSLKILELTEFGKYIRTNSISSYNSTTVMSGTELISIILAVIVFAGGMATSLCILCVRYKRKRIKPSGASGIAYSIARLPSSLAGRGGGGGTVHSKTTSTSAGTSPHSKASIRDSMMRSGQAQIFPGFKTAKGILANYDQRQLEYIDVPLPKSVMNSKLNLMDRGHEPSPACLRYTQIHSNSLSPTQDASMQSHHSSGHDSGVGFISTSRERSDTPSEHLLRILRNRSSMNEKPPKPPTNPNTAHVHTHHHRQSCQCRITGRNDLSICCNEDSSDSYEDSLKNTDLSCSHQTLHSMPIVNGSTNITAQGIQIHNPTNNNHHRFRRSYRTPRSKRNGTRHSFSGVRDDLTQESPRITTRPRVHSFRNSMTDLEHRLHNLEQSFREPFHLNNSRC